MNSAASEAPLSFVFGHISGASPVIISAIAIAATLNGVIIQIIMASRVLYGLAKQGHRAGHIRPCSSMDANTIVGDGSGFGSGFEPWRFQRPSKAWAEWTSRIVLIVFANGERSFVSL